jgi:hypothetical protein
MLGATVAKHFARISASNGSHNGSGFLGRANQVDASISPHRLNPPRPLRAPGASSDTRSDRCSHGSEQLPGPANTHFRVEIQRGGLGNEERTGAMLPSTENSENTEALGSARERHSEAARRDVLCSA